MELGSFFLLLLLLSAPPEALSAPCENGGTAVGDGCACLPGYHGTRCQDYDPAMACQNGGTAVGTECYCPPGFVGPLCQHPDPAGACRNGATPFGTVCVCPPGFHGDLCQYPEKVNSCLNGGSLVNGTCHCPPWTWGPRCECTMAMASTTVGGDEVSTVVSDITESHGTVVTVPESSSVVTILKSNATAMGSDTTATTLESNATAIGSDTTATTLESSSMAMFPTTLMENHATAVEKNNMATTTENTTTAATVEDNTTATTMEGNTTATIMEGDTTATTMEDTAMATTVENNTMATTMEDTTATTMESHTMAMERSAMATILESNTTTKIPATSPESNTTATTPENTTMAELTSTANRTMAMERDTMATTKEDNTMATTVENTTMATIPASSSMATTIEDKTLATTMKDNTTATTVERTTAATFPTTPWETSETLPGLGSTTDVTGTTMATFCLYLPHGSSPPAIICRNGGVANISACLCPPGFTGPTCEAVGAGCGHGGTAIGGHCLCPPGRAGPRCDRPDPAGACRNGGTAVGTRCYCPSGFQGPRCEESRATSGTTRGQPASGRSTRSSGTVRRTTMAAPTTADPCLNGGRWTGFSCLCPPNLEGDHCQFAASTINITAELGPSVMLLAHVTNRKFSEDMADTSSAAYHGFAEEFRQTMDQVYQNVSGYRGSRVLALARGSIVVNYKVLLDTPAGDTPPPHPQDRAQELLAVTNATAQPPACSHPTGLCFNVSLASSTRATAPAPALNATELCRKLTPANFSRFYFPHWVGKSLLCVTNCSLNLPGALNCLGGLCRVTLEGPRCFCPDVPWYLTTGEHCQTHISKLGLGLGVGLGLGLTLLLLLLLCIVLTICLAQSKKKAAGTGPSGEDTPWPDGRRNTRVTGIYHVNGRGSPPHQDPYRHSSYRPNMEVAVPTMPVAEGAASL